MQVVRVARTPEIEAIRTKLPAVLTEQEIVDAVRNNDFSIVCGDTGCGKSTQVPQFLYEAGFTEGANNGLLIGVTQPRRVAAVSVSERVGFELNDSKLVGYQVRYDRKLNNQTMRLKFMTDGILLREIQDDIRLPRYSVIVIDEAHERSINCDMLLGLLSGSVRARKAQGKPLKIVIMSATLRMTDFTENRVLFPNPSKSAPAVVQIDNRMHSVTVHYERRTEDDYIASTVEKIRKLHRTLPQGSVLVFVTGKAEVHKVCNSFRSSSYSETDEESGVSDEDESSCNIEDGGIVFQELKKQRMDDDNGSGSPDFNLGIDNAYTEELSFKNGKVEQKTQKGTNRVPDKAPNKPLEKEGGAVIIPFTGGGAGSRLRIMPLYAQMSSERQMNVFRANEDFPEDRIVVVSTNVAETSLTIPNIRYVIDCGREKRKEFNSNGVSRFAVRFTSKASANQRAGRAGRVGPGHVYRLYSPNVFGEHMPEYASAEIETNPLDSSILFLKSMGVPSFLHFPWPSPPPALHVESAIRRLKAIAALSSDKTESVTAIGKEVSRFPLSPRLAVCFVHASQHPDISNDETARSGVSLLMLAVVSMLSVDCLQSPDTSTDPEISKGIEILNRDFSDDLEMMLSKFVAWTRSRGRQERDGYCVKSGLNAKAMDEARSLFYQLAKVCGLGERDPVNVIQSIVKGPLDKQILRIIRESCIHGFVDQIAIREGPGLKTYRAPGCSESVHIHRSSVLYRLRPQLIAFAEMQQASGQYGNDKRTMRICFPVDPEYLATIDSPLIDKTKPHPMLKPSIVKGRRIAWMVPRYIPLSVNITDCVKVDLGSA